VVEAGDLLISGMRDATIVDRSGERYKPATCRSYEQALRTYIKRGWLDDAVQRSPVRRAALWTPYIGHSDIRTTYTRYGRLMFGGEAEDAARSTPS
jgi:hypothetical protein